MSVMTPISEALERYLSLNTQQMKTIAGNMANVDTPGYKTQGFDFGSEMARAMDGAGAPGPAAASDVDGLVSRPDGNNVSMDRESTLMAETQIQFRTGVELWHAQYSEMMSAIKSGGN